MESSASSARLAESAMKASMDMTSSRSAGCSYAWLKHTISSTSQNQASPAFAALAVPGRQTECHSRSHWLACMRVSCLISAMIGMLPY